MTDYTKLADELMPKKRKSVNGKDCTCNAYGESECGCGADWSDYSKWNQAIDDCTPIVADLLKQIDELEAGSIEVGVEEIYEELKNWGGNIQSSQSLTSEEMDEFLKDIAQSINNLKEKE